MCVFDIIIAFTVVVFFYKINLRKIFSAIIKKLI
jgi:hypothetical protein